MKTDDPAPASRGPAPAPLLVAASITAVEGLLTLVFAGAEIVNTTQERIVMGGTTALFFALYAITLLVCARGLQRCRPWARGPVLLSQLIWLGLAWNFRDSEQTALAAFGAVAAVIVIVGLVHPASTDALAREA